MISSRSIGLGLLGLGLGIGLLVPIFLVAYPAAGIAAGDAVKPGVVLPVLAAKPGLFMLPGILEIVGHTVGAVAILGLWVRFGQPSFLLTCATVAGLAWMAVDIVDNAIAYHIVPGLAASFAAGDASAGPWFVQLMTITDGVRLGAHLVGGLWIIGLSVFSIRSGLLPAAAGWFGVATGAVLSANIFVPATMNASFMMVPVWLVVVAALLMRAEVAPVAVVQPRTA